VLTVGWRWAFLTGVLVAVPALLVLPRRLAAGHRGAVVSGADTGGRPGRHKVLGDVVPVAVAVGLGMAAISATGAFYVESAVAGGIPAGTAGLLLALGGVLGVTGRFLIAWRLSRLPRPYVVIAVVLVLGGLGAAGFAAGGGTILLAAATVPAFGAGWGWNGLLAQTVVASHPEATARASAYVMVGGGVGGALGPSAFGVVVTATGYRPAWMCCAAAFGLAAAVLGLLVRTRSTSRRAEESKVPSWTHRV
jgi:predicted MFS family arabinose efflux permease